jgi:hypothetical protein
MADIVFSGPIGPVRTASFVNQIQSDNATCSLPCKLTASLEPCRFIHKPHSFAAHCCLSAVINRTGLPQLLVCENPPEVVMLVMESADAPVLVNATLWAGVGTD